MKPNQVVMDIENYSNYLLVMFVNAQGKSKHFEMYEDHPLDVDGIKTVLNAAEVITFNGMNYDMPILALAMSGATNEELKRASDEIIVEGIKSWNFYKKYRLEQPKWNHIDLIEPAPAVKISLKLYGGRLHSKRLQDLPIEPDALITPEQRKELILYCRNDLDTTIDLLHAIEDRIELRRSMSKEYGMDLRSKSDAQIAEAVIKQEVEKILGQKVRKGSVSKRTFFYQKPDNIKFESEQLKNVLRFFENVEITAESNGVISFSQEPPKVIIGSTTYQLGLGGLHSQENECYHQENDEYFLEDNDVGAYYPNIILQLGLYPESLGSEFITVFRGITEKRLLAKKNKDKLVDTSMKIMINGTFGKLGSIYSILYAPNLLIQTTISGQLYLLMLIEMLYKYGIEAVSGNTDGIVLKCHRHFEQRMRYIIKSWENHTGFQMEGTRYSGLYSRDVNSYCAVKPSGEVKTKGFFATGGLSKSPTNEICSKAFVEYLKNGTLIEDTIYACDDITQFLSIRTVKGGAVKDETYLGKAIRWYYSTETTGTINYKSNGNTVPRTEGAKPCMLLPETLPDDIDYTWYIREANDMLMDVGLVRRPKPTKIPRKNCKAWLELVEKGYLIQQGEDYVWYTEIA
jgi:hypothetical protein